MNSIQNTKISQITEDTLVPAFIVTGNFFRLKSKMSIPPTK
jgi:hypothetical protein